MLMPSLVWPLVRGPKPAMMRPFAGQRNDSPELPARTGLLVAGASVAVVGVEMATVSVGCWLAGGALGCSCILAASLGSAFAFGALSAFASFGSSFFAERATRLAGMLMRSPMLTLVCGEMLLSRASSPS